jgi:UDP-sugar transporter A1/2/3
MFLLALQFASQPILTQKFAPKTIIKSTYVLAQELVRLVTATSLLLLTGNWQGATRGWNYRVCFTTVGIPAVLYILQNRFSLTAYQHLSPITFNVLNQSKTLSAAIFCFLLLGQSQSKVQMGALALLFLAVFVMEVDLSQWFSPENQKHNEGEIQQIRMTNAQRREYYLLGVIPVLLASAISGLAGALIQRTLQTRDSLLFSIELACISIGLLAGELLFVRPQQPSSTWTTGWSLWTWIPVVTNAMGGILVGLVTKYAGAVEKGFALILGMVLSGALQNQLEHEQKRVSLQQWMGGLLAGISLWLHSQFPTQ